MKKIIISTKPPQEYKKFLKSKDNQNINGGLANLAEEGSLRRIDSNAEESDGKDELDDQDEDSSDEDDPKFQQKTEIGRAHV